VNLPRGRGVLHNEYDDAMAAGTTPLTGALVTVDEDLEREFEARLVESSTLAFRVAFGVLRQREDAEDVAQEALTRAYRNFRTLRDRDRFSAWLVRMAWRLAINRQRSDRRRLLRETGHAASTPAVTVPDAVDGGERSRQLWAAIGALPEKLRVVTVLGGIEGHDIKQVARLLGLREGTVKSRLFLARRRLKELLQWTKHTSSSR
jgi:RNA polymerase sigma-70 factor, ECF subfamily